MQIDVDIPRCHQYDELLCSPRAHGQLRMCVCVAATVKLEAQRVLLGRLSLPTPTHRAADNIATIDQLVNLIGVQVDTYHASAADQ